MRSDLEVDWSTVGEYSTDLYSRKAVEFINKHNKSSPLFLYLSQIAPHAGSEDNPLQATAEEIKKFEYIPDVQKRTYAGKTTFERKNWLILKF